jgi:hypothetical protein
MAISPQDAAVFFQHAHEDTEGVDVDARFQLRTLSELVQKAEGALNDQERPGAACDFAALISSVALRIGDRESFPWGQATGSLARMSPGVALAAVARWEDAGIAGRDDTLEAVLPHLKIPGVDRVATFVAMNPLLQSDSLLEKSAELVASQGNKASSPQVEDLCRDALILNDGRRPTSIAKNLEEVPETGVWLKALDSTEAFRAGCQAARPSPAEQEDPPNSHGNLSVSAKRYILPDEILDAVRAAKSPDRYISPSDVLKAVQDHVATADRIAHLDALKLLPFEVVDGEAIVSALEQARQRWATAAVSAWLDQAIPALLSTRLAGFCGMLVYFETDSALDRLLNLVSDRSSCNRPLLRGLGESLDALTAGAVYEVCRRVIQSLRQEDAKDILLANLRRLVNALPDSAEVRFDITDIPPEPTEAVARFLFALMSDVDTRVRWRAAHCLRRFVHYGGKELLPSIAILSKRTAEDSFRVPRAILLAGRAALVCGYAVPNRFGTTRRGSTGQDSTASDS